MGRLKPVLLLKLKSQQKAFEDLQSKVRKKPTAGKVHRLRVLTRRLRAPLWLALQCHDTKAIQKAQRGLRKLGRSLGELRKWDVAIEDAEAYAEDTAEIESQRRKAVNALQLELKPKRMKKLSKVLGKAIDDISKIPPIQLASPLEPLRRALLDMLEHSPKTKPARHHLRIRLKRVRYLIESLGHQSASLEKLQEALGREHDLDFLQSFLGRKSVIQRDELREQERSQKLLGPAIHSAHRELGKVLRELGAESGD